MINDKLIMEKPVIVIAAVVDGHTAILYYTMHWKLEIIISTLLKKYILCKFAIGTRVS